MCRFLVAVTVALTRFHEQNVVHSIDESFDFGYDFSKHRAFSCKWYHSIIGSAWARLNTFLAAFTAVARRLPRLSFLAVFTNIADIKKNKPMKTTALSRSYLETLSSADLLSLADNYGIDVPEDLSRRFIIGELLDVAAELSQVREQDADMTLADEEPAVAELPGTFNETQIGLVLRNPVWAYVYWDIRTGDLAGCTAENDFVSLVLRVTFFDSEDAQSPQESFDVQVGLAVREQYVLLPTNRRFMRVDLVACFQHRSDDVLASTQRFALPQGSPLLSAARPGNEPTLDRIQELSSLRDLLHAHYEHHRQSFLA